MKKCGHCGKDCRKLVPAMVRDRITMVGTGCAKNFKRPKRKDLYRANTTYVAGDEPAPMSDVDFNSRFPNFEKDLGDPSSVFDWLYNWKGAAVVLKKSNIRQDSVLIQYYDPYSKNTSPNNLVYKITIFGPTVSIMHPGDKYAKNIQEMLDKYPKWDPLAKYGIQHPTAASSTKSHPAIINMAVFIKKISTIASSGADRRIYKLTPPMKVVNFPNTVEYVEYVVVSGVTSNRYIHIPETYIFRSDLNGQVTNFTELPGSFKGSVDHKQALNNAGYTVVP